MLSVDEDAEMIEIQHVDGDVEEIDLDTWAELDLDPTGEPEGWSGSEGDDDDEDWEEDEEEDEDDWDDDDDDEDDEDDDDDYDDQDEY